MPVTPINDWSEALMTSFSAALVMFLGAIPRVIAFAIIVIVGWFIASALASLVVKLLRAVRFNDLAYRSGFSDFVHSAGVESDSAGLIATITKWFVRLITLVVAFDALGLPAVSQVLQQLLLWLPNLVVALVILVLAGLAANAVSSIVRGAAGEAGFGNPGLLANVARFAIWAFAIVVAVNQLGIATTLVNTLFMATVGALALALGLAFGLGGRDTAGRIVSGWYERSGGTADRLARAADAAKSQAQQMSDGDANRTYERPAPMPESVGSTTATVTREGYNEEPPFRDSPEWVPTQSPPDPNFGRPLHRTQND
jgi:hypothetical protein